MPLYHCDPQVIEADFGQGPLTLYVWPLSLSDTKRIRKAEALGPEDQLVAALIVRARNENRSPMWNNTNKTVIFETFSPSEINRVLIEMKDGDEDEDETDEAGN